MSIRIENTSDQIAILDHRFQVVTNGAVQWSVVLISQAEIQSEIWFHSPLIGEISRVNFVIQRLNIGGRGIAGLRIDKVEGLSGGADYAAEQIPQSIRAREIGSVDAADLISR